MIGVKVAVDANILIDMFERREPHYLPSAQALNLITSGKLSAVLPAHTIPNIYYVIRRIRDRAIADEAVDWMLRSFDVVAPTKEIMRAARNLSWWISRMHLSPNPRGLANAILSSQGTSKIFRNLPYRRFLQ